MEQHATRLPDCRAYEQVSPVDKYAGIGVANELVFGVAGADGNQVFYKAFSALPGSENGRRNDYRATRSADGWVNDPLLPASSQEANYGVSDIVGYMQALSAVGNVLLYDSPQPLDPEDEDLFGNDLYLRQPDGTFVWLSRGELNHTTQTYGSPLGVMSADGTRVVFLNELPLLAQDTGRTAQYGLYEWHEGKLSLAAVDNEGNLLSTSVSPLIGGSQSNNTTETGLNPISSDGSVFFFAVDGRVYLRRNGETQPLTATPGIGDNQQFMGATPDGKFAYFITNQRLTADDTDQTDDLYRFSVSDGSVVRASSGTTGTAENADVQAKGVQVSDDGSHVYFVAKGQLTPDAPSDEFDKIYLRDGSETRFVAEPGTGYLQKPNLCEPHWQVTPDGQHLLIKSVEVLTPDDLDQSADLYVYSASDESIVRASGGPTGGNGEVEVLDFAQLSCPPNTRERRLISDNGRYVFFETDESLVPDDENNVGDVYEHDLANGKTYLLSGGVSEAPTFLADAGASGRDVFIATWDRLAPSDIDGKLDLFDVRIGGGLPMPTSLPECEGEGCQGMSQAAPGTAEAASAILAGKGNVKPRRNCRALARLGRKLALRSRSLARASRRSSGAVARHKRVKAHRLNERAHRIKAQARRCRAGKKGVVR